MKPPTLGPKKICSGVYLVGSTLRSSPFDSAVYALLGDGGSVALIDCGSPFGLQGIEANLRKLGADFSSVETVIATHSHYDHVGGIAALKRLHPDITFSIHINDAPAVEEGDPDLTCAGWMFQEEVEPVLVDKFLSGGDSFSATSFDFEILSMPGHSPGSISILTDSGDGPVLFTGDCYVPSCDLVGYDFEALSDTWKRLLEIDAKHVCPGHFDHHLTHPVVRALTGKPGAAFIRRFLLNPDLSRIPASLGSKIYQNGKVPVLLKSFYSFP